MKTSVQETKQPLWKELESYLRGQRKWVHGETITRYGQSLGYEGETARRRLRELVVKGKAETKTRRGMRVKSNWYRYVTPQMQDFIEQTRCPKCK